MKQLKLQLKSRVSRPKHDRMQSRWPSDVDDKATNQRLINWLIPTLTWSTHKGAVSYLATRWRVQLEAILQAGRLWNKKHIFKNSKGLWVTQHGYSPAEAEECILWLQKVLFIQFGETVGQYDHAYSRTANIRLSNSAMTSSNISCSELTRLVWGWLRGLPFFH